MTLRSNRFLSLISAAVCVAAIFGCSTGAVGQTEYLEDGTSGVIVAGQAGWLHDHTENNGVYSGGVAVSGGGKFDTGISYNTYESGRRTSFFFLGSRFIPTRDRDDMSLDLFVMAGLSVRDHFLGAHIGCGAFRRFEILDAVAIVPALSIAGGYLHGLEGYAAETSFALSLLAGFQFKVGEKWSVILEPEQTFDDGTATSISLGVLYCYD